MNRVEPAQQFRRRDNYEAGCVLRKRGQDKDPEISLGIFDFLVLMCPPSCGQELVLKKERLVSWVEVLRKLDLERYGPRVSGICREQVNTRVLRRHPNLPFRVVFLNVRPDEVFARMNCEQ